MQERLGRRQGKIEGEPEPNIRSNIKVAKLQVFDRIIEKISGFLIVYKLCVRMKMRNVIVGKQVK